MDPGVLIIILIFFVALLSFAIGVYCHFCGETGSGGRYFGSNENIAAVTATALYTKRAGRGGDVTRNKCKCSKKFKGVCTECEGEGFVDDGELGSPRDFSNFGGDRGFEFPGEGGGGGGGGVADPIRGFMGNGSAPTSALDQPDHGGGGSSFGGGGSDQY